MAHTTIMTSAKLAHLLSEEEKCFSKQASLVDIDGSKRDDDISKYPT